jgi:hypothetical protein
MIIDNNQWIFKKIRSNKIKLGKLNRDINNLIVNSSISKGNESDANLIIDNIWLGNHKIAHDYNFVISKRIKYIINVTDSVPNIFPFINYITFPIKDTDACRTNLMNMIECGACIINKAVAENKPILVHCKRGHHRSAAIVAFYLMKYRNMSLIDALCFIKKSRPGTFRRMTCMLKTLIIYEYMHKC